MLFQSVLSRLAEAGLATKAAAGSAAVVVATSAAGAADALPEPAQDAFDRLTVEETVEVEDLEDEDLEDGGAGADDVDANFGERVSEDAKDGGVGGCEIAREASGQALEDCGTDTDDVENTEDDESDAMEGFGEEVAEDARGDAEGDAPGVDGEEISQQARERNPGDAAVNTSRPGDDG